MNWVGLVECEFGYVLGFCVGFVDVGFVDVGFSGCDLVGFSGAIWVIFPFPRLFRDG